MARLRLLLCAIQSSLIYGDLMNVQSAQCPVLNNPGTAFVDQGFTAEAPD